MQVYYLDTISSPDGQFERNYYPSYGDFVFRYNILPHNLQIGVGIKEIDDLGKKYDFSFHLGSDLCIKTIQFTQAEPYHNLIEDSERKRYISCKNRDFPWSYPLIIRVKPN